MINAKYYVSTITIQNRLTHCLKENFLCFTYSAFSHPQSLATPDLFTIPTVLPLPQCHLVAAVQDGACSGWLLSCNRMHLRCMLRGSSGKHPAINTPTFHITWLDFSESPRMSVCVIAHSFLLEHGIPSYGSATVCIAIRLPKHMWVVSSFWRF